MELPDIHFNKSEYIETASGNRNSLVLIKDSTLDEYIGVKLKSQPFIVNG